MNDNVIHADFGKKDHPYENDVHEDGTPIKRFEIHTTEDAIKIYGDHLLTWPMGYIVAAAFRTQFDNAPVDIWKAIRAISSKSKFYGEFTSNFMETVGRPGTGWHTPLVIEAIPEAPADIKPAWHAQLYAGFEQYLRRLGASGETNEGTDPWTRVFRAIFDASLACGHVVPTLVEEGDSLICYVGVMNTLPSQPKLWYKVTYTLNGSAKDFNDYCALAEKMSEEE